MSRVTAIAVENLLSTDTDDKITVYLETANAIVTGYLGSSGLSDTVLAEIEKNLVAHFVTAPNPNLKAQTIDVISQTFKDTVGVGLVTTTYGQTAILLDSTGILAGVAASGSRKTVTIGSIDYNENN